MSMSCPLSSIPSDLSLTHHGQQVQSLDSLLSLFFFSFDLPPLFYSLFFALYSSVFIGKKQGRERLGQPLCCHPPTRGKLWANGGGVDLFLKGSQRLFEGEGDGKQGNKTFFFPCFLHFQGEEERLQCSSKPHRFGFFFFT